MPRVVIGGGLAHDGSRFILVQVIVLYVQLGVDRMYCLSPSACESWGVISFRGRKDDDPPFYGPRGGW
jgi:hypothetical protein